MPHALYLHVPFCPHVCPYCDFHKMLRHEGLVTRYLQRLEQEAVALYRAFPGKLDTIYLGGGTPSHLTDAELLRIRGIFERTWGWPAALETTLEADPLTFDRSRLQTFREAGFNRLSIGMQSTQDEVLRFLGRQHSGREGLLAVGAALEAGFEVSADLITAVPGQDAARDLRALAATGVPHVSVYTLTVEPYTPFARRSIRVDADREADDYELANRILTEYGLERYEVSSHARVGHESKHNQVYWHGEYFLALGPSAASFVPSPAGLGERRTNPPIKGWLAGEAPEVLPLGPIDYLEDLLMTGLRTRQGVDIISLERRTDISLLEHYGPVLHDLIPHGLLELRDSRLRATQTGLLHLDGIMRLLYRHRSAERSGTGNMNTGNMNTR
jgi:putative oxygen-independent coproporphyrinogen III oxidase